MVNDKIKDKKKIRFLIDFANKNLSSALIGNLLKKGKKNIACMNFYKILANLKKSTEEKVPVELIMECVDNVKPTLRLKSKKVGGTVYQIPVPLKKKKEYSIGIKWLIDNSDNKNSSIAVGFSKDVLESVKLEGELIKKKENDYKLAATNRPFLKFLK